MTQFEISKPSDDFPPEDELLELFRQSYGDNFKPLVVPAAIEKASKIISIRHHTGRLAAAATLEGSRIAMMATSNNRELGHRMVLGYQLMEQCHEDGSAAWMSIGLKHRVAQVGARAVGMKRIQDTELAESIVKGPERDNNYELLQDEESGLLLVSGPELAQPGYKQQIWAWLDRIQS